MQWSIPIGRGMTIRCSPEQPSLGIDQFSVCCYNHFTTASVSYFLLLKKDQREFDMTLGSAILPPFRSNVLWRNQSRVANRWCPLQLQHKNPSH